METLEKLSQQIAPTANSYPKPPARPFKPSMYDHLLISNPNHDIVMKYDMALMKYEHQFDEYIEKVKAIDPVGFAEQQKKREEYFKKLQLLDSNGKFDLSEINPTSLYNLFLKQFELSNGVTFDENANDGEAKKFAYTLILYFLENEKFYDSPLLNKISEPSIYSKGILVMGGYGCGKTSVFKTINELFLKCQNSPNLAVYTNSNMIVPLAKLSLKFAYKTANGVIDEYEECETANDKANFWSRNTKYTTYFDDVLTERAASNYGKVDIFTELFQKRNGFGAKTIITCNYADGQNLEDSLKQFLVRYGGRVYDRLFEMFNIIELKGSSLRV